MPPSNFQSEDKKKVSKKPQQKRIFSDSILPSFPIQFCRPQGFHPLVSLYLCPPSFLHILSLLIHYKDRLTCSPLELLNRCALLIQFLFMFEFFKSILRVSKKLVTAFMGWLLNVKHDLPGFGTMIFRSNKANNCGII